MSAHAKSRQQHQEVLSYERDLLQPDLGRANDRHVAAGRFDSFWEQHLRPWDVAAGTLIVTEAGGDVTGMDGSPFDPAAAHLVASNGRVHDAVLDVILAYRAGRARQRTD